MTPFSPRRKFAKTPVTSTKNEVPTVTSKSSSTSGKMGEEMTRRNPCSAWARSCSTWAAVKRNSWRSRIDGWDICHQKTKAARNTWRPLVVIKSLKLNVEIFVEILGCWSRKIRTHDPLPSLILRSIGFLGHKCDFGIFPQLDQKILHQLISRVSAAYCWF